MKNYIDELEYDEDSDYILSVIEEYEKQGITTNVDFTQATFEKETIESKQNLKHEKEENYLHEEKQILDVVFSNKKEVFENVL